MRAAQAKLLALWCAVLCVVVLVTAPSLAAVRFDGTWPDADKPISVEATKLKRGDALRKVADAAGWSVVLQGVPSDEVDLHVTKQPAGKVLALLLSDQRYVASRDGDLISIAPDTSAPSGVGSAAALAASAAPSGALPAASAPPPSGSVEEEAEEPVTEKEAEEKAPDRVISGGSVRVEKDEVVHDVVVFGGNADVLGTATGDVTVIGGYARIHPGAHVHGDATAVGGKLTVDDGARVDGDVGVVGGVLDKGKGADVRGVSKEGKHGRVRVSVSDDDKPDRWSASGLLHEIGSSITRTALLFVFGAIFLALAAERMQALQGEIAARPMRSMALGVVGALVTAAVMIALCVTIVGIPFAVVAALLAAILIYVGVCAALTVLGAALLRHRTTNPYIHLGLGCALFLLIGWLPYLGTIATIVVGLVGFGSLLATRGAGFVRTAHAAKP